MEFVVTKIERSINWFERFKVNVNFTFLSFGRDDFTTVDDQAIRRDLVVKLETLLRRSDGRKNGKSVHTRFDVGSSTLLDCG